jgi:hypothetical protein
VDADSKIMLPCDQMLALPSLDLELHRASTRKQLGLKPKKTAAAISSETDLRRSS